MDARTRDLIGRFVSEIQSAALYVELADRTMVHHSLQKLMAAWPPNEVESDRLRKVLVELCCRLEITTATSLQNRAFASFVKVCFSRSSTMELRNAFRRYVKVTGFSPNESVIPRSVEVGLRYIDKYATRGPVTLEEVAREARLSRWHFSRLLQRHTGQGFAWHLRESRMRRAISLVDTSLLSIKELAAVCGYSSVTEFGRQFKKRFGTTPTSWRDSQSTESSTEVTTLERKWSSTTNGARNTFEAAS